MSRSTKVNPDDIPTGKTKKKNPKRGVPRSAGKKGSKKSGFYFKIIMEAAKKRRAERLKKREERLDRAACNRLAGLKGFAFGF